MAEDIATSDTETSEAQETPVAPEVVEKKAAKPRKPRARKTATEDVVVDTTPAVETDSDTTPQSETIEVISETTPTNTEAPTPEPVTSEEAPKPKKRAPRKPATKNVATEEVSESATSVADTPTTDEPVAEKPKPKRKSTPRKKKTEPVAEVPVTPAPTVAYVPIESDDAIEDVPAAPPTELTEATKRKRKPKTKLVEIPAPVQEPVAETPVADTPITETPVADVAEIASVDTPAEAETNSVAEVEEKPAKPKAKRRTAANAKTAAPRTRKTIKPVEETAPEATSAEQSTPADADPEAAPKPKRRTRSTTAKTTADKAKSTPKPRTRKPKTEKVEATDESAKTTAIPDPSAPIPSPPVEDDRPLIINTDDAIAESEKTSTTTEPETAKALGSERTVVAPQPVTPTIIERVPPRSSKRLTMTILFVVVGIIGLGAGWALGLASNGDTGTKSKTPTIATIPGQPTPSFPGQQSSTTPTTQTVPTGDLFTLSGSSSRQSALFTLPSTVVQMHYDSTGGTFSAKLLPEAGGDGTTFDCQSACDKEQPIQANPGRYYFEVQSSGGDWNIHISN